MIGLLVLVSSHLPTYSGGCDQNCCKPPKVHTESQVIYLKGSGGLEIHLKNDSTPIDYTNGEMIDFDVVFRDNIDATTYSLYIGCLGCVPSDPIAVQRTFISKYEPAVLEPFTQTVYRSAFPKSDRKFDSRLLDPSVCNQEHFGIRLVDHMNRSDGKPIVWAPVIGLSERETLAPESLIRFPIFVISNHGDSWNEMSWTLWFSFLIAGPAFLVFWRSVIRSMGGTPLDANPITIVMPPGSAPRITLRLVDPREGLYELAIWAFVSSAIEQILHTVYWQFAAEFGWEFFVALSVALLPNGIGILFASYVWDLLLFSRDEERRKKEQDRELKLYGEDRNYECKVWTASPGWGPLEIITGLGFMFFFGAGFYIGPVAIMLAGFIRIFESPIYYNNVPTSKKYEYRSVRDPFRSVSPLPERPASPTVVPGFPVDNSKSTPSLANLKQ